MALNVVVTGGTGLLGRSVVQRLVESGHQVRILSRDPSRASVTTVGVEVCRGDLRDPATLQAAISSAEVVVHCASDFGSAQDVDVAGTRNLLEAAGGVGVGHLVYVSIVGVDRIPLKYYRAKREAEVLIENQGVPWTIQRATQFHPFIETLLAGTARLPLMICPKGLRFQPIGVDQVAGRLGEHVAAGPSGMADDLGGPEVLTYKDLASTWLSAVGRRRPLVQVPLLGRVGRALREGANLCPDHASGGPTWQQYLDATHGARG